jgi:peptidoglycan L-alanyl-D-glutamate endopeptidase CwlK
MIDLHKKRHGQRLYFLFLLLFLVCVAAGFFFYKNSSVVVSKQPAPLPTAMNPNFLTQVNNCFIPTAAVYGYTLRITAGFRSIADQTLMYDQGRTVNGHIVSEAPPGHSLHNYGYAVDVVDRYRGYNINWTRLVKIAAYCSLESGGVGDLPHFEERGGLTTDQFQAGMRPGALTLPCPIMVNRTATSSPLTLKDLKACGAPTF